MPQWWKAALAQLTGNGSLTTPSAQFDEAATARVHTQRLCRGTGLERRAPRKEATIAIDLERRRGARFRG